MTLSPGYWWHVFFGFSGRIPRGTWWVATVVLMTIDFGVILLFINPDIFRIDLYPTPPTAPAETLFGLAMLIPGTAVSVKRFNDRSRPHWLGYVIGIGIALISVVLHFNAHIPAHDAAIGILFLALAPFFVWLIIDQGFMSGTKGNNCYGPEPNKYSDLPEPNTFP